jgi:hypothetical protein
MGAHQVSFFDIQPRLLYKYGAFNVSLVSDLPLFIDPFLLFNSKKPEYQKLHAEIIKYLRFLRDKSIAGNVDPGLIAGQGDRRDEAGISSLENKPKSTEIQ